MKSLEIPVFYPASCQEWRDWLEKNHQMEQSVWLIYYKKKSIMPSISWSQAVDEALCFGWIDSTAQTIDEEKYRQFFTRRKPNSVWSKVNKEKVKHLIEKGLMMQAGYDSINIAKKNGSWTILDEVEELTIPDDLNQALANQEGALDFFLSLSKSIKKGILYWLVSAKRAETRQNRINEIVEKAAQKQKPKQF